MGTFLSAAIGGIAGLAGLSNPVDDLAGLVDDALPGIGDDVADDLTGVGDDLFNIPVTDRPPTVPLGRRGNPLDVEPGTNAPTNIGGRNYTGHALDQMQGRITPSVVEDTITRGARTRGHSGATVYTGERVRVVVNPNGSIKTVYPQ